MKLSIIIPVFNEEKTIENIINRVSKVESVSEIIAVNDGSYDKTSDILKSIQKKWKKKQKFVVINHGTNFGKGRAIQTGVKAVTSDYLLIQDADLEYDPEEYNNLSIYANKGNVVYGSRLLGKNKHAYLSTYLGNIVITGFCNLIFGSKLTDSYTCFKLLPSKIAKELNLKSNGFEIEAEITAKLLKRKIEIKEVAIKYHPRSYEKGKKIKARDAVIGALKLVRIRFGLD